jgi:putative component of membrane protein insertase Oxa1/YidC/SpoIIIJ protein YidD
MNKALFATLIVIFPLSNMIAEEPWGKDADLARKIQKLPEERCRTPFFGNIAETMIGFHKKVISPADGPRSNHKPNSSGYTLDAMRKYGFFYGYLMGCDRLMRENDDPWIYPVCTDAAGDTFKWDPVK